MARPHTVFRAWPSTSSDRMSQIIRRILLCFTSLNVQRLFSILPALFFVISSLAKYFDSVFRIYITRTTPYSRRCHQIACEWLAFSSPRTELSNTYCMACIVAFTSMFSNGNAVVDPIRASCKAVLYLLIVVGCTSADGSEKSQYLVNVLGGGSDIHR